MVDRKQLMVVWNVGNLKISHQDTSVVTDLIRKLDEQYGKDASRNITLLTIKQEVRNMSI